MFAFKAKKHTWNQAFLIKPAISDIKMLGFFNILKQFYFITLFQNNLNSSKRDKIVTFPWSAYDDYWSS